RGSLFHSAGSPPRSLPFSWPAALPAGLVAHLSFLALAATIGVPAPAGDTSMSIDTKLAQTPKPEAEPVAAQRPRPKAEPVAASERVASLDVVRGVAVLGILAMNIVYFAWPSAAYGNPLRGAGFTGSDRVEWVFNHVFFSGKMMTLFSMLFGAGL